MHTSQTKLPVSVVILTHNEEDKIRSCIESVSSWAGEIFVVDSGSTDRTAKICAEYTDKVYQHPFENYARQRNWAQKTLPIQNEWVMHLDADEIVSEELADKLRSVYNSAIYEDGFFVPRRTVFAGRWIRHGGHYPVYHLRLFRRSKGQCEDRLYDQHFMLNGNSSKIDGDIINTIGSLSQLRKKENRWAALEAAEVLKDRKLGNNGRGLSGPIEKRQWMKDNLYYKAPLFIRPAAYFLYRYIIRLGFLDGKNGFLFHFWQGFWFRFLVDKKIMELKRSRKW